LALVAKHVSDVVFDAVLLSQQGHRESAILARGLQLSVDRQRLQQQSLSLPDYWTQSPGSRRWKCVPLSGGDFASLAKVVALSPSKGLGGRDQRLMGTHSGCRLTAAWRVENQDLFARFQLERERLKAIMPSLKGNTAVPAVRIRDEFWQATEQLPGVREGSASEVYLAHGTKPETVLSVISGGLNERFSGGLFGNGSYFAEDIAKADQYVTQDKKYGDHGDLHKELYKEPSSVLQQMLSSWGWGSELPENSDPWPGHPGQVFYVFLCRVALGHHCRTLDGSTDMDTGTSLWSSPQRELAAVPGTSPAEPYHSLLAEVGLRIKRYREFVVFHGERIYPEYLLAYQRV